MHRMLVGSHVQRLQHARVRGREVLLLRVRVPGENVHLVVAGGGGAAAGVGVVGAEESARLREALREAITPAQAGWRARVEGARVTGVTRRTMEFEREGTAWRAKAEVGGEVRLEELREEGQQARVEGEAGPESGSGSGLGLETLREVGARIAAAVGRESVGGRRDALRRGFAKAIARVERRAEAVRGDLARAESADSMAAKAQLFVPVAGRAPRGATQLVAVDWSTGEAREVEWKLDPARGAQEQLDALFQRARRLKEGARIARARLEDAERALSALREVASLLEDPPTEGNPQPDFAALEARARAAAPRDFRLASGAPGPLAGGPAPGRARGGTQPPLPPYRVFASTGGRRLLVGRGAEKNDALTFHVARPHDLWLHAKNRAGAHVVVPLEKGASCPADVLVEAAHLAAHFSEARDERVVEVQYTPRRYLRKPRGSAPGLVVVDREKVLVLRREDDLLRRLLEREEDPSGANR